MTWYRRTARESRVKMPSVVRRELNSRVHPMNDRGDVHDHVRQDRSQGTPADQIRPGDDRIADEWLDELGPTKLGEAEVIERGDYKAGSEARQAHPQQVTPVCPGRQRRLERVYRY